VSIARIQPAETLPPGATARAKLSVADMERMAEQFAKSRLFPGIETTQAAFALMMLCEAEGLHPASALRRYHIISGRPSMRADAMQAEFQRQGGRIEWICSTAEKCAARFYHATHAPDGVEICWDQKRVARAELNKNQMHRKYPEQMLRARVVSEGVRMVLPGIVAGIYTPEEVEDFQPPRTVERRAERRSEPAAAALEGELLAPFPSRGTPDAESKARWTEWELKLLGRWERTEPYSVDARERQAEIVARQHRIAHALVSDAITADPNLEGEITDKGGKRNPSRTWRLVHELCAGDWAWVKNATLEHLKKVVDGTAAPIGTTREQAVANRERLVEESRRMNEAAEPDADPDLPDDPSESIQGELEATAAEGESDPLGDRE
jgi:hypothetical protein